MAPEAYDDREITVPEGLVFVYKYRYWCYCSQGSRVRVTEIPDLYVLRNSEYLVRTQDYIDNGPVTTMVANRNGSAVILFSARYVGSKSLAKWHSKAQEQGYLPRVELDTAEPTFGGKFDELRASGQRISSLPPSDATKAAQESIRAARKSMLDALHVQQQATPDEIALAEALVATQIAEDAAIRRLALEQAREELNSAPYTPSE